jgi:hypothetical protein
MRATGFVAFGLSCMLTLACSGSDPELLPEDTRDDLFDAALEIHEVIIKFDAREAPEAGLDVDVDVDVDVEWSAETMLLACEPGEGCFMDKCSENGTCQSGWCIEHMGEKICTQTCEEECPAGWTCVQVAGTVPDLVFVCVSNYPNLCRPCAAAGDCAGAAGTEDACVGYGDQGAFCGGKCGAEDECPWGFACQAVVTVDGIELAQCVAETGLCPCTDAAIELGLFTHCQVSNDSGTCQGKRICTMDGLTDCDAAEPAAEVCNGLDDDCDGDVDEPVDVGGEYVSLCHDDNDCTLDACNGADGCHHEDLTEGECLDGDACTIGDHCHQGICVGQPIACDDGDVCTDDICDGLGGCTTQYNTANCDDADPCTVNDLCKEGICGGYPVDCECTLDAHCQSLEDGNLCNGTLLCDITKLPYTCKVKPETVIACPEPDTGPDAICLQSTCDPVAGQCSLVADHEGFSCDDGDLCSIGDKCIEGLCTGGVPLLCKDDNPCTDDSCDPLLGCLHSPNALSCNDGNVCTAGDTCLAGECAAGEPLICDDSNVCNGLETCDPAVGCQSGVLLVCADDDDVCTDTDCQPGAGCVTTLNQAYCDDGDPCTIGDQCHLGSCQADGNLDCDDGNECTDDTCNGPDGCVYSPNAASCDDGTKCTAGDHCAAGWCVAGSILDCHDDNPCTDDSCDPLLGCVHSPNVLPCNDGNVCSTGDTCLAAKCEAGESLICDDNNVCNGLETCDPAVGCQAGAPLICADDDDVCTDIACQPGAGCVTTLNQAYCDDGDPCTLGDKCHLGNCQAEGNLDCDDGNECTDDTCNGPDGCVFAPNAASCDDGTKCTTGDHCAAGWCLAGGILGCQDDEPCTDDSCDALLGCVHSPNALLCDDGNVCTDDVCDPQVGCQYTFNEVGCPGGHCEGGVCYPDCPGKLDGNVCWLTMKTKSGSCNAACAALGGTCDSALRKAAGKDSNCTKCKWLHPELSMCQKLSDPSYGPLVPSWSGGGTRCYSSTAATGQCGTVENFAFQICPCQM